MKRIVSALLIMIFVLLCAPAAFGEESQEIKVYVNGEQVEFGEAAPVIKNGRVLAPARGIFERLDAVVSWNPDTKHIIIGVPGRIIELRVGSKTVRVSTSEGSRQITSDVAPEIIKDTTFVPLAVIAEGMRGEVMWVPEERTVLFSTSGFSAVTEEPASPETPEEPAETPREQEETAEAPEEQEEPLESETAEKPEEQPEEQPEQTEPDETGVIRQSGNPAPVAIELPIDMKISGISASFSDTTDDIAYKFAKHSAQSNSVYGYAWQEINSGRDTFVLVGQIKGEVVAFYSNSARVSVAGITPGMSASRLNQAVGEELPLEKKALIKTSEGLITVYRNALEDYSVLAVMAQKNGHTAPLSKINSSYYTVPTERQLFEIINMERANRKLDRFKEDKAVSQIARSHSEEMAAGNYLSGEDSLGQDTFERMDAVGIMDYEMASESVGRDCIDAIELYYQWMNSRTDSANILADNYNFIGIGVSPCPNNHKMYFTADFIER